MADEYRFRWYCSPCCEGSDWFDSYDDAKDSEVEHITTHDEVLYEPTRIQRYRADKIPHNG